MYLVRRIAGHHSILTYIFRHHGTSANSSVAADINIINHTNRRTYIHIIAYHRSMLLIAANGGKLANVHVVAYHRRVVDDDALRMADKEAIANLC